MSKILTPAHLTAMLAVHSCRAEPIVPDGWTVPNGYTLRGPRGNRKVIAVDRMGNVPEFDVLLWLDGIAYGNRQAARRMARPPGSVYQCDDCSQLKECTQFGCVAVAKSED